MDVLECIRTRRSVRKFKDKPVEWEKVSNILDAARLAPSAGNLQMWKFVVVTDEATRAKIADACLGQKWMESAPVHFVINGQNDKAKRFYGVRGERLYTIQSCAAAVENMLLAAHSQGLGACWVSAFDDDEMATIMNVPEEFKVQAVVPVGYADETPEAPPKDKLEQVTHFEKHWAKRRVPIHGYYGLEVEKQFKKGKKFLEKVVKKIRKEK